jgi:type VI secretion system protein ImpM
MACGLFGKLAAKRDFIALNLPVSVLLPWENWMQAGIAFSRNALGPDWLDAYLHAPLWRFRLGAALCGQPVAGVFMPSIDGVGRHFPLTVFSVAPARSVMVFPGDAQGAAWFAAAEDFLLATLDAGEDFQATTRALEALPDHAFEPSPAPPAANEGLLALSAADENALPDVLARLASAMDTRAREGMSYFWTIGGAHFPPLALGAIGLPGIEQMPRLLVAGKPEPDLR